MAYLVKWSELGTSKWGEATLKTLDEVREYLTTEGYSDNVITNVTEDGVHHSTYDAITMEEVDHKPVFIVLNEFGTLRTMKRPTKIVSVLFECRSQKIADQILLKTAKRISKYRFGVPVTHSLKRDRDFWLNNWIHQVTAYSATMFDLGDVKLIKEDKPDVK